MKKVICAFLIFTMIIFLVNPLSNAASRGRSVSGRSVSGRSASGHSISNHSRGGYWRGGYSRGGYWRGGYWRGGYWGWWAPWAVIGGAAVWAPYYYDPYYYSPYYEPPLVVDQEQPSVDVQPAPSVSPSTAERIFIYPRNSQSEELQAKDRYECHRWGVSQTGYDPTQPTSGMPRAQLNQVRADYKRAMSACLDARGYTMK
ncbi:MAG: hypothetical protein ABSF13_08510 [Smithella sp.]|jgi:hypothetical protein